MGWYKLSQMDSERVRRVKKEIKRARGKGEHGEDWEPPMSINERRLQVPAMEPERYRKFESFLKKHGFTVTDDSDHKGYKISRQGENLFYHFGYWQVNQRTENVLAVLTMRLGYTFPHTPVNSYRCPDCGRNTDAQVEAGPIEGTPRCQECYDANQEERD